jgi:hypothetical protein
MDGKQKNSVDEEDIVSIENTVCTKDERRNSDDRCGFRTGDATASRRGQ